MRRSSIWAIGLVMLHGSNAHVAHIERDNLQNRDGSHLSERSFVNWFKRLVKKNVFQTCVEDEYYDFLSDSSFGQTFCQAYMDYPNTTTTVDYTPISTVTSIFATRTTVKTSLIRVTPYTTTTVTIADSNLAPPTTPVPRHLTGLQVEQIFQKFRRENPNAFASDAANANDASMSLAFSSACGCQTYGGPIVTETYTDQASTLTVRAFDITSISQTITRTAGTVVVTQTVVASAQSSVPSSVSSDVDTCSEETSTLGLPTSSTESQPSSFPSTTVSPSTSSSIRSTGIIVTLTSTILIPPAATSSSITSLNETITLTSTETITETTTHSTESFSSGDRSLGLDTTSDSSTSRSRHTTSGVVSSTVSRHTSMRTTSSPSSVPHYPGKSTISSPSSVPHYPGKSTTSSPSSAPHYPGKSTTSSPSSKPHSPGKSSVSVPTTSSTISTETTEPVSDESRQGTPLPSSGASSGGFPTFSANATTTRSRIPPPTYPPFPTITIPLSTSVPSTTVSYNPTASINVPSSGQLIPPSNISTIYVTVSLSTPSLSTLSPSPSPSTSPSSAALASPVFSSIIGTTPGLPSSSLPLTPPGPWNSTLTTPIIPGTSIFGTGTGVSSTSYPTDSNSEASRTGIPEDSTSSSFPAASTGFPTGPPRNVSSVHFPTAPLTVSCPVVPASTLRVTLTTTETVFASTEIFETITSWGCFEGCTTTESSLPVSQPTLPPYGYQKNGGA